MREHGQNTDNRHKMAGNSLSAKSVSRYNAITWAVSSAVRASGLHPEGPAFKSLTAHQPKLGLHQVHAHVGGYVVAPSTTFGIIQPTFALGSSIFVHPFRTRAVHSRLLTPDISES